MEVTIHIGYLITYIALVITLLSGVYLMMLGFAGLQSTGGDGSEGLRLAFGLTLFLGSIASFFIL